MYISKSRKLLKSFLHQILKNGKAGMHRNSWVCILEGGSCGVAVAEFEESMQDSDDHSAWSEIKTQIL